MNNVTLQKSKPKDTVLKRSSGKRYSDEEWSMNCSLIEDEEPPSDRHILWEKIAELVNEDIHNDRTGWGISATVKLKFRTMRMSGKQLLSEPVYRLMEANVQRFADSRRRSHNN
mmetsp:Transcript_14473/g.29047  ORF Transcript_14473/g.29047 Transcript_14473/m.29047 type:complete len:114 (-) Transcript_14473:244-585(-)